MPVLLLSEGLTTIDGYNARGVHELADERWIAVKIEDDESIEEECSGSPHGTYPRSKVIEPALSLEHIIILSQP
jgi:hypothetical protein